VSGFIGGGIVSDGSEWYDEQNRVLIETAALSLTLPTPTSDLTTGAFERLGRLGFKIGLLLENGLQIEELVAGGVTAQESPSVSADLASVFGSSPGHRWVGLTFKPAPSFDTIQPNVAMYQLRLRLRGVQRFPQLIPAPSRFGNDASFSDSYLSALWVVDRPTS
jgi:hypothetical protein